MTKVTASQTTVLTTTVTSMITASGARIVRPAKQRLHIDERMHAMTTKLTRSSR